MFGSIGDLFVSLGLKPDATWGRGEKLLANARKTAGGIGQSIMAAFNPLGQLSGLIGTAALGMAVRETLAFEESLTRLDISSRGAMGSISGVKDRILALSDSTGVSKEQLAAAAHQFIALTGDADATKNSLETFARVQKATGSEMQDLTATAAALQQNLNVDPGDFEKAFSILIAGGKAGKIELNDMASTFAQLTPLFAKFEGGTGVGGLARLGATFQLAAQGFGSAKQTMTGLQALVTSLTRSADKFKDAGVDLFTTDESGKKVLKDLPTILKLIKGSKLGNDPTGLVKAFGSVEALQAYDQLVKVPGALEELEAATMSANDVAEDYAKFQASVPAKISKAWNKAKNVLTTVLYFLAKNFKLVTVAVLSLAAAMVVLQAKAVFALGLMAVKAALAALPFLLIATIIAALILIVEDLWVWIQGGDSVLKELWEAFSDIVGGKIADLWRQVWTGARDLFDGFVSWVIDKLNWLEAKAKRIVEIVTNPGGAVGEAAFDLFGDNGGVETAGTTEEARAARRSFFEGRAQRKAAAAAAAGNQTAVNTSIVVNSPSTDPVAVASEVDRRLGERWDRELRTAEAASE